MLSGVLRSHKAIQVNIAIMRTFVHLRRTLASRRELREMLRRLERKILNHDAQIQKVFDALGRLNAQPEKPPIRIGLRPERET